VRKYNAGGVTLGCTFTWTITVVNNGARAATFNDAQAILLDDLPNANINYGAPSVGSLVTLPTREISVPARQQ